VRVSDQVAQTNIGAVGLDVHTNVFWGVLCILQARVIKNRQSKQLWTWYFGEFANAPIKMHGNGSKSLRVQIVVIRTVLSLCSDFVINALFCIFYEVCTEFGSLVHWRPVLCADCHEVK
jgi:hypothetical protein